MYILAYSLYFSLMYIQAYSHTQQILLLYLQLVLGSNLSVKVFVSVTYIIVTIFKCQAGRRVSLFLPGFQSPN